MNELDRQIQRTMQTLVALQAAKIAQLERENASTSALLEAAKKQIRRDRELKQVEKKEAQA